MGKRPLIALVVVLLVAAIPAVAYLAKPREIIVSTPSAFTGLTVPLPLPARGEACVDQLLFDTNAEIARFGAIARPGTTAPGLEVVAAGEPSGAYRSDYRAVARVAGGWNGERRLDVPLTPPRGAAWGTLCVRNLDDRPVDLVGSENGRAFSRPSVKVNGEATPIELQLRFMQSGEGSLLARAGAMTRHAAVLNPFGAWWYWVLVLALLVAAPLAVLAAVRAALAADGEALAADRVPGDWPSVPAGVRERLAALPGWAMVAAGIVVATVWFCYWAFSTHVFQGDEYQYVYLSRWLQTDFPASLFDFDAYGRGLQRLEVWLLAIPSALFDAPLSLQAGRVLNAVAFASTAIPVYLLGRRLSLRPAWATLPALLSIAVPWAVVTTGFLTESVAYPAFMWAVWAIFRAATAPSPGHDLLALVVLVVAGAARSGLLILAPVLPVVVAATALRCGEGLLPTRVRAALRDHAVLWAAVALGALALLADALGIGPANGLIARVAGGYTTATAFDPSVLLAKVGGYLARLFLGTGFFPAAVALPWLAVQLVRSRQPERFALAAVIFAGSIAMLYSLNAAGPDERYVLYLAPLVLLGATAALAYREITPAALAVGSGLIALLLVRVTWSADQGLFGFFVAPVEMFWTRTIGLRFGNTLPGDEGDWVVLAAIALGAGGIALAAMLRWTPARLAGAPVVAIVAAVALSIPVQTEYAFTKFVNGAGSKAGPSVRERAFVDTTVPDGASVGEFREGVGLQPGFAGAWQEVRFYNERVGTVYALGKAPDAVPLLGSLVDGIGFDPDTGAIRSPQPLPDYLVVPGQVGTARVRGEVVAAPSYVPVLLLRVAEPATLEWSARGFGPLGEAGARSELRFYGARLKPGSACASFLVLAGEQPAPYRFRRDGRTVASGTVDAGASEVVQLPLPDLAGRDHVDVRVGGTALRVGGASVVDGC